MGRAIALRRPQEPYTQPEIRTFPQIVNDVAAESPMGSLGAWWMRRAHHRTGEPFLNSQQIAEATGPLTLDELYAVYGEKIQDAGEATRLVLDMRAKSKRQQRMQKDGLIETLVAGAGIYAPQIALEYGIFRGLNPALKMLGPRAARMRHPVSRDLIAAGGTEFSLSAMEAAVNPYDGIDDAIINGAIGTAFAGTFIGGIEAYRAGKAKYLQTAFDNARDRAKRSERRHAAAEAAQGKVHVGRGTQWTQPRDEEWAEIAGGYGYNPDEVPASKWREGYLQDNLVGRKWVNPKGVTRSSGWQFRAITRKQAAAEGFSMKPGTRNVLLRRRGHTGDWEIVREARSSLDNERWLIEKHPTVLKTDSFLSTKAHQYMQSNRVDIIREYDTKDPHRTHLIQNVIGQELDELDLEVANLSKRLSKARKETPRNEQQIGDFKKAIDKAKTRADTARRNYNLWLKDGEPLDWVWQGKGAETMATLLRAIGQLPFWNVVANKAMRGYATQRLFQDYAERLVGNVGAVLPDATRAAVESVDGAVKAKWWARWESYDQELRDIWAAANGMEPGISSASLRFRNKTLAVQEKFRQIRGQQVERGMTWEEFELALHEGMIDYVELNREHPNAHVQKAVVATTKMLKDLEYQARQAGVFAHAQAIQRQIDEVRTEQASVDKYRDIEQEARTRIEGVKEQVTVEEPDQLIPTLEDAARTKAPQDWYDVAEMQRAVGEGRIRRERDFVDEVSRKLDIPIRYATLDVLDEYDIETFSSRRLAGRGFMSTGEDEAIVFIGGTNTFDRTGTLLHEVGHAVDYYAYQRADKETKQAIYQDYLRYLETTEGLPADATQYEWMERMSQVPELKFADQRKMIETATDQQIKWFKDFEEWKAEQIRLWFKSKATPHTLTEKFFKSIADSYKQIIEMLVGKEDEIGSAAVNKWMDEVWNRRVEITPQEYWPTLLLEKKQKPRQWRQRKETRLTREEQLLARYKELTTAQQQLREALPEGEQDFAYRDINDQPEGWVRNGIEMRLIRQELDKLSWDQFQKSRKARLSEEERVTLQQIQNKWSDVVYQAGSMTPDDVNAKFAEMMPLLNKLSKKTLTSWLEDKKAKVGRYDPDTEALIADEISVLEQVIRSKGRIEEPTRKSIERIWASTRHLESDLPSVRGERLHKRMVKLEDRLAEARYGEEWGLHMNRKFSSERIDADIEGFKQILRDWFTEHPERYEGDPKPRSTDPAEIEKRVEETIRTIHGENTYNDLTGMINFSESGRPLSTGALGRRRLDIPSHKVRDFLEPHQVEITRTYFNKIAQSMEMNRILGDPSGENYLADLIEKARAEGVPQELIDEQAANLRQLRDAVLGLDGLDEDPMRLDIRGLRAARYLNVMAFMGRVPQMMLLDSAYMVHIAGFKRMLAATGLSLAGIKSEMKKAMTEDGAKLFAVGSEVTIMSRASMFFNEPIGRMDRITGPERKLQQWADNFFYWTGASWFTDFQRRQAGVLVMHDIIDLSNKLVQQGSLPPKDGARLRSLGIDEGMARRIHAEWMRFPEEERIYNGMFYDAKLNIANATRWEDVTLAAQVGQAVRTELDNVVFTANAATRPKMMRSEYGRAFLLYSTIGIHMTQTMQMRMLQRGMRNSVGAVASMLAMAWLVDTWRKPDYITDDPEDAFYSAVALSGVGGFAVDAFQKLADASGTQLGLGYLGIDPKPWAEGVDIFRLNPIGGQWSALMQAMYDPELSGDDRARAIKYMAPYNNHWIWNVGWNMPDYLRQKAGEVLQ